MKCQDMDMQKFGRSTTLTRIKSDNENMDDNEEENEDVQKKVQRQCPQEFLFLNNSLVECCHN